MTTFSLSNIYKSYVGRTVLRNISIRAQAGEVVGILGANGSGKSTLMRVIAGILRPDSGTVSLNINSVLIDAGERPLQCGFVAPYLQVYDEFSPTELMTMHAHLHGKQISAQQTIEVLTRVGLLDRMSEQVRTFSSGMRQRVTIALATCLEPPLLLLDEPSTTLDQHGREILVAEIAAHRQRGGIVFLATNDGRERNLCTQHIDV